jgi:hypothetical protein
MIATAPFRGVDCPWRISNSRPKQQSEFVGELGMGAYVLSRMDQHDPAASQGSYNRISWRIMKAYRKVWVVDPARPDRLGIRNCRS